MFQIWLLTIALISLIGGDVKKDKNEKTVKLNLYVVCFISLAMISTIVYVSSQIKQ